MCSSCADAVFEGWCVACASRPEARLHISTGAWGSLGLAVGGVILPPLAFVALWRTELLRRRSMPAEAPVLQSARWVAVGSLVFWAGIVIVRALG